MPKKYDTFASRSEISKENTILSEADVSRSELCKKQQQQQKTDTFASRYK